MHPTAGRRRRYKSSPVLHDADSLPLPRLEDRSDTEKDPSDGDGEKKLSVRNQGQLRQCLPRADRPMNMMLSWGSHEWELRKLKSLRRV